MLFRSYSRTAEKWILSEELFRVVTRATADERSGRQQSIRQLKTEWEECLDETKRNNSRQ